MKRPLVRPSTYEDRLSPFAERLARRPMNSGGSGGLQGTMISTIAREDDMTATDWTSTTTGSGEYADVNGLHLYYEIHGPAASATVSRPALVLLHGGLGSGEMFGPLLPTLAEDRRVIVPDLQGHGRTADIDRPLDVRLMAGDIAKLVEALGSDAVDVMGYSLGGGVGMHLAFQRPDLVRRLVAVSANIRRDAIYPEMLAQQGQMDESAVAFMRDTPMYELYQRVAPRREDFGRLLNKIGAAMAPDFDFSDAVRGLTVPTLIACADADMAPPSHYVD